MSDLLERGEKIIGKMAFWNEIPLVGPFVLERLADELDATTDLIERGNKPAPSWAAELLNAYTAPRMIDPPTPIAHRLRVGPNHGLSVGETVTINKQGRFEITKVFDSVVEVIARG